MDTQENKLSSSHPIKTAITATFLVLATIAFALTVVLGVGVGSRVFLQNGESNTLEEGLELLAYIIYYLLIGAVCVVCSVVSFIMGIVILRRADGRPLALGKASVVLSSIYIALPLLYVLVLNFV